MSSTTFYELLKSQVFVDKKSQHRSLTHLRANLVDNKEQWARIQDLISARTKL